MKALKLEIYQETACYKKPMAFKTTETYPLPPYSTVIGMIHKVLKAEEYFPMDISIQGKYESLMNCYNTMMFYKSGNITKMPLNINMLYGIELIIHIKADESTLDNIYKSIKNCNEYLSLGRGEDIARLDSIRYVEIKKEDMEDYDSGITLIHNFYIPKNYELELKGIKYRLNKRYEIIGNIRNWREKIEVTYVEEKSEIESGIFYLDSEEDLVFFA